VPFHLLSHVKLYLCLRLRVYNHRPLSSHVTRLAISPVIYSRVLSRTEVCWTLNRLQSLRLCEVGKIPKALINLCGRASPSVVLEGPVPYQVTSVAFQVASGPPLALTASLSLNAKPTTTILDSSFYPDCTETGL